MVRKLFATDDNTGTAILRLVLGVVFFAHGAQKLLGWFGGYGISGTMGFLTGMMHIPAPFAFLAIAAEFFGGLGLILGFLTRIAALGIAANMAVAIATVHRAVGFFMNWNGTQKGEGFEFAGARDHRISDDPRSRRVFGRSRDRNCFAFTQAAGASRSRMSTSR